VFYFYSNSPANKLSFLGKNKVIHAMRCCSTLFLFIFWHSDLWYFPVTWPLWLLSCHMHLLYRNRRFLHIFGERRGIVDWKSYKKLLVLQNPWLFRGRKRWFNFTIYQEDTASVLYRKFCKPFFVIFNVSFNHKLFSCRLTRAIINLYITDTHVTSCHNLHFTL